MTRLSKAVRNLLVADPAIFASVGNDTVWLDGWIFFDNIYVRLENTQSSAIVITENSSFSAPNPYNTMLFPKLTVDIWSDPTRSADNSIKVQDAKDKIEALHVLIKPHLHTINMHDQGQTIFWGTPAEISTKTGVAVAGSQQLSGPEYSPIKNGNGAWMGRFTYGINFIG